MDIRVLAPLIVLIVFLFVLFLLIYDGPWHRWLEESPSDHQRCLARIRENEAFLFPELEEWQRWENIGLDPTPFLEIQQAEEARQVIAEHMYPGRNDMTFAFLYSERPVYIRNLGTGQFEVHWRGGVVARCLDRDLALCLIQLFPEAAETVSKMPERPALTSVQMATCAYIGRTVEPQNLVQVMRTKELPRKNLQDSGYAAEGNLF